MQYLSAAASSSPGASASHRMLVFTTYEKHCIEKISKLSNANKSGSASKMCKTMAMSRKTSGKSTDKQRRVCDFTYKLSMG